MVKVRMRMHNARKVIKVSNLAQTLSASDVKQRGDSYAVMGLTFPELSQGPMGAERTVHIIPYPYCS